MWGSVRPFAGRTAALCLVMTALAWPGLARAGNGLHPRTTVIWDEAPCMNIVDRSVDPVILLNYAIPYEDTEVTEDEVADSRTHQFLAFCRDKDPQTVLPNWVAWADVLAAAEKPLDVDPTAVDDDSVLDLSPTWSGCWARITQDADRRPITEAMAAQPVAWDTTGLSTGPWVVYGYTYEPAFNIYVRRPGLLQIVDDPDPAATGPAVSISTGEQILYKDGETTIEACVSAMDGATITASWALAEEAPQWVPFIEDEPVAGTSVSIPFVAPEGLTGKTGMIRMDIQDPMGRTYTTYMADLVMVLMQQDPTDCGDGGGSFVANPGCDPSGTSGGVDESGGQATSGDASTTGSDDAAGSSGPSADGSDGSGGKCSVGAGAPGGFGLGLLGLGLLGLARRRRAV